MYRIFRIHLPLVGLGFNGISKVACFSKPGLTPPQVDLILNNRVFRHLKTDDFGRSEGPAQAVCTFIKSFETMCTHVAWAYGALRTSAQH